MFTATAESNVVRNCGEGLGRELQQNVNQFIRVKGERGRKERKGTGESERARAPIEPHDLLSGSSVRQSVGDTVP
jgi:hypothetical protein